MFLVIIHNLLISKLDLSGHNALEDAIDQGVAFCNIFQENKSQPKIKNELEPL